MNIIKNRNTHPSMVYPRKIMVNSVLNKITCPACKSPEIEFIALSPEQVFKRQSMCLECNTIWTTRNNSIPVRYKQKGFYQ